MKTFKVHVETPFRDCHAMQGPLRGVEKGASVMKKLAVGAVGLIMAGSLAACGSYGESHDYNAKPPVTDLRPTWDRIETPGNYHTMIFACEKTDGIYENQADDNSVMVIANDPNCK